MNSAFVFALQAEIVLLKLKQLTTDPNVEVRLIEDLENLLRQPSCQDLRPCPGCTQPCRCSGSSTCTCDCGPTCKHAPQFMTSDPEYPIESRITSLVFAFNCLRVCPPYWSCEGHLFPSGEVFRVPQVWFYARSMIYPKLISEYIGDLNARKTIYYPWHVCLTFADNRLEVGFSIEPDTKLIKNPLLRQLQEDARAIADGLCEGVRALARDYLRRCK